MHPFILMHPVERLQIDRHEMVLRGRLYRHFMHFEYPRLLQDAEEYEPMFTNFSGRIVARGTP